MSMLEQILPDVFVSGRPSANTMYSESFIVKSSSGNIMVNTPEYSEDIVSKITAMGGLKYILITSMDNIGDACSFRKRFRCQIIINKHDRETLNCIPDIETDGDFRIDKDSEVLHLPGYSRGSSCLLFRGRVIFSGNSMVIDKGIPIPLKFEWTWDWEEQKKSIRKLLSRDFDIVVSGMKLESDTYFSIDAKNKLRKAIK